VKNETSTWRYKNDAVFHTLVDSFVELMKITDPVFISREDIIDAVLLADNIYHDEMVAWSRQYGNSSGND
jgi:hypothetical protein